MPWTVSGVRSHFLSQSVRDGFAIGHVGSKPIAKPKSTGGDTSAAMHGKPKGSSTTPWRPRAFASIVANLYRMRHEEDAFTVIVRAGKKPRVPVSRR